MPCHSEIGQSKSLFLLTVALLCFQAKKLPFSNGNGHSDWLTEWVVPVQLPNNIPSGKHKRFTFLYLQSVSWSLAEFRHNKIVQLLRENCFNVCRQLQRKVRSRKHDV